MREAYNLPSKQQVGVSTPCDQKFRPLVKSAFGSFGPIVSIMFCVYIYIYVCFVCVCVCNIFFSP